MNNKPDPEIADVPRKNGLESVLQHISVEFAKARDEGFQKSLDREPGIEVEVVGLEPRGRRTLIQKAQPIIEVIQEAPKPENPRTKLDRTRAKRVSAAIVSTCDALARFHKRDRRFSKRRGERIPTRGA